MEQVIVIAAVAVAGFVAGGLVYRNNAKKAEEKAAEWKGRYDGLIQKIGERVKR